MDCCESDGFKRPPDMRAETPLAKPVGRRGVLKGTAFAAGTAPLLVGGMAKAAKTIQLAFCSNLLCATSFDDVLQAFNRGADIRRFCSTGRLPLQALAVAPNRVAEINSFKDLEGRTIGEVSRGGIAEALTLFLM